MSNSVTKASGGLGSSSNVGLVGRSGSMSASDNTDLFPTNDIDAPGDCEEEQLTLVEMDQIRRSLETEHSALMVNLIKLFITRKNCYSIKV